MNSNRTSPPLHRRRHVEKQIGKPPFVPSMLYGTGGTFTALAAMIMAERRQSGQPMWGYRVTGAQIRHLLFDSLSCRSRSAAR